MKMTLKNLQNLVIEMIEPVEPAYSADDKKRIAAFSIYSDVYKEKNGIRPRWVNWEDLTLEELDAMLDDLYASPGLLDDE